MKRLSKGLHLHFDPLSGIAGDMTVAALVDAGVPAKVVSEAVAAMKVAGLDTRFERRQRGAYVGTGFVVSWPGGAGKKGREGHAHDHEGHDHGPGGHGHAHDGHDHAHDGHGHDGHGHNHDRPKSRRAARGAPKSLPPSSASHRDYASIRKLLAKAPLDADARALAEEIFALIAQAESALHGVPLDRIGFHEVGAYDSIADIVGAAAAIAWLEPSAITSSAPVLGTGQVRTEHGLVPVPAPATTLLLSDAPVRCEGIGELTTPTGAAILAATVDRFGPMPPARLVAQGFGAGTRQLTDRANVLRVLLGEPLGQTLPDSADEVVVLEANIDDMNPQLVEPLFAALFAAGAVDAWATPILMKKGRPALTVSALVPPPAVSAVVQAFFENSTTIGLRTRPMGRVTLSRSSATVKTPYGKVSVKLAALDGKVLGATPEFEDCRRLAKAAKVPVRVVWAAAMSAANFEFQGAGGKLKG